MARKPATFRKPLRADQFPIPHDISDEDFREICATYGIRASQHNYLKLQLEKIIQVFGELMKERPPMPKSDRIRLEKAILSLDRAREQIGKLGPSGTRALAAVSSTLAPMVAAKWICSKFPGDDYAPERSAPPRSQRNRIRNKAEYFIEEFSLEARTWFVQRRSKQTVTALVGEIGMGLRAAQRALDLRPGTKGGRKSNTYRHDLIINLAETWNELEKRISTSAKSDFTSFCETVFVSMGLPEDGLGAAVPKAVKAWRNLRQKLSR